jgi:RimJ/RimL family protein N-acetyltransferase
MVRLEGERLSLREWRADEVDAMHRWLGDPIVTHYLSWGSKTLEDSARHLAECLGEQERPDRERYFLAMELRESQQIIGDAGFHWAYRDGGRREGEFGYFVEAEHWGRGYATESAKLVLLFAFDELGASIMRASCDARNAASERVMLKCGMKRDPDLPELPGRLFYRVLRENWNADRAERRR